MGISKRRVTTSTAPLACCSCSLCLDLRSQPQVSTRPKVYDAPSLPVSPLLNSTRCAGGYLVDLFAELLGGAPRFCRSMPAYPDHRPWGLGLYARHRPSAPAMSLWLARRRSSAGGAHHFRSVPSLALLPCVCGFRISGFLGSPGGAGAAEVIRVVIRSLWYRCKPRMRCARVVRSIRCLSHLQQLGEFESGATAALFAPCRQCDRRYRHPAGGGAWIAVSAIGAG